MERLGWFVENIRESFGQNGDYSQMQSAKGMKCTVYGRESVRELSYGLLKMDLA